MKPTPATPPRALIVSVFGMYARQLGGWLSVAAVIRLMAELGVDEAAVRSSVSRLKRRGILVGERAGGVAGYALSERAVGILEDGDRRIFQRRQPVVAHGWVLAVFSVPERDRHLRHQLRSRLAGLGFGTVTAGVWVAPAHVYEEARHTLERASLAAYVDLFRAEHLAFADLDARVAQWWDLDGLQARYRSFLELHGPAAARYRRRSTVDDRRAFADFIAALTAWRRLPYADPGLPLELLPKGWNGQRAADTFFALHDALADPALSYVRACAGRSDDGPALDLDQSLGVP